MSKIRSIAALATLGLIAWIGGPDVGSRLAAQQRPNIVLIFPTTLAGGGWRLRHC